MLLALSSVTITQIKSTNWEFSNSYHQGKQVAGWEGSCYLPLPASSSSSERFDWVKAHRIWRQRALFPAFFLEDSIARVGTESCRAQDIFLQLTNVFGYKPNEFWTSYLFIRRLCSLIFVTSTGDAPGQKPRRFLLFLKWMLNEPRALRWAESDGLYISGLVWHLIYSEIFEITWNKLEKNTIVLAQKYIFT